MMSKMLELGVTVNEKSLKILPNKCLQECSIPSDWKNTEVVLIFEKGDCKRIENYQPFSQVFHMNKLLARIITNRLSNKFDDHLQSIRTLIEKVTEYNIPFHLAFIVFHEALIISRHWLFWILWKTPEL